MRDAHVRLLEWFEAFGRHELPWRETRDPYAVFLSEVMLQQTQANRVASHYYPYFLSKYPTLEALGDASLDDILSSWSGLGYYSRAQNLHKALKICKPSGIPRTMEALLELPGVGTYTASAVCSFAYEQPVSVVDTNIKRVMLRYFGIYDAKEISKIALEFLNTAAPRDHNLALMDLGSLVCTAKNPSCLSCPLAATCRGKNEPESFTKKKKIVYEKLDLHLGICIKNNKVALIKSQSNLYKGLLILPEVEPDSEQFLGTFKHSYTKYRLTVNLYSTDFYDQQSVWIAYEDIDLSPLPSLTKKALYML